MPKRVAEEPPPSSPDSFGHYKSEVTELLSQEETTMISPQATVDHSSDSPIGAGMSKLKRDHLNVLLRQCVKNLTPEVDEMQECVCSLRLISQLGKNCPASSPSILQSLVTEEAGEATEDDMQLLLRSDPDLVKKITSQYSNVLHSKLENMQQQLEELLDNVVNTCRPMTDGEKQDLEKSIKELPERNLDRIAEIVGKHYTSGKDFSDNVIVNLDNVDNIVLWRLHFYVGAVKNAQKLAR